MSLDRRNSLSFVEYARFLNSLEATEGEKKILLGQFLEKRARERSIPIHGCFELTPLCNLDCLMCYVHLDSSSFDQTKLLSIDVWKSYIEQAVNLGMRKATFTGGECLSYYGFNDVYQFSHNQKLKIDLISNGALLDTNHIELFSEFPPQSIQISLYGSNEDAYEKVTGHRVFTKVLNNIQRLKAANLPVCVSITPSRFMVDDIKALIKLTYTLDIPYKINAKLIQPRSNTGRKTEDLTLEEYIDLFLYQAKLKQNILTPTSNENLPSENQKGDITYGLYCGAGKSTFTINYKGEMMPCVSLHEYSVPIKNNALIDAWHKINLYVDNYLAPCECKKCIYFYKCNHCQGLHKNALKGHCDKQICERTKKMAEVGLINIKNLQNESENECSIF